MDRGGKENIYLADADDKACQVSLDDCALLLIRAKLPPTTFWTWPRST